MERTGEGIVDGKYEIIRLLGKGGMGAVYEAEHRGTGRRVALKVIVSEALAQENDVLVRFQREARASGSIDSQHVVQILDTGVDPATRSPYMVMELLSGEDVFQLRKQIGPLDPELVLRIIAQACLGLERAHDKGVIHRDIKTANMFLARREGGERVLKLLDFGIAKVRADRLSASDNHGITRTGAMIGSPLYMSPEQARGSRTLDGRSDLFSLGIVMYEALTGAPPNAGCESLGELILAICSQQTDPIQNRAAWIAPEVAAIVHQALAHDPAQRFESAVAMHAAIAALLPQGAAIREGMLVGVSDAMRAYVAPRFEPIFVAPLGPAQSPLASTGPARATGARPISSTTVGVGSSEGISPITGTRPNVATTVGVGRGAAVADVSALTTNAASPARWLAPVAGLLLLGGIGAGAFSYSQSRSKATSIPRIEASSAPLASAAPAETATAAAVPTPQTVQVSIAAPADAKVEVDGRPVEVKDGKVDLRGIVGSVHPVRVTAGGREARADVAIAETGPIPASVELVVPKTPASGTRPVAPTVASANGASAVAPGVAVVPAAPKRPESPKPPAGAPTINREF